MQAVSHGAPLHLLRIHASMAAISTRMARLEDAAAQLAAAEKLLATCEYCPRSELLLCCWCASVDFACVWCGVLLLLLLTYVDHV
jgi:hypothetical protein